MLLLGGSVSEVILENGSKTYFNSEWTRANQRNMTAFDLPDEFVQKSCLVVMDFEVCSQINMKTSMTFCMGGALGNWQSMTPCHGVNGGWRPAIGYKFTKYLNVTPSSKTVTFMQWWSGSGGASKGYYWYQNNGYLNVYSWTFKIYC